MRTSHPSASRPAAMRPDRGGGRLSNGAGTIFAAGDVVGFPSLAATSIEQGRLAALAAFSEGASSQPAPLPYGIYTMPEIPFVGLNERELTDAAQPYVRG